MRVLVTGYKGYVGSVMVPLLHMNGYDVTGVDSGLYKECLFGANSIDDDIPKNRQIEKDIRDIEQSDLYDIDAVIHLAALSNDPLGNLNPEVTYEINHQASVRLAQLAKKAGVERFLFSSSCSIYGAAGSNLVTEEAELKPVTPYGISKMLSEQDIAKLADSKFSPVFLRSATAYGFSPMIRFDIVLNNLVAWAYTTGSVLLKSDGTAWRPIVHCEDMSRAFIAALETPQDLVHNEAFNVGITAENFRVREIAEIVKETVPGSSVQFANCAEPDQRSYRVDFTKITGTMKGFTPKWNARLGAKQLYDMYKAIGVTVEEFEGPKYRRITCLENKLKAGLLTADIRRKVISG
jgi:nucleoside-diphosphate-sugar epimerase